MKRIKHECGIVQSGKPTDNIPTKIAGALYLIYEPTTTIFLYEILPNKVP